MFDRFDHAAIAVRDLATARECYTALLGRAPSWLGAPPRAGCAAALYRLDNSDLVLLAPEGEGPLGRCLASRLEGEGEGVFRLAFATPDAARAAQGLRSRGIAAGEPAAGEAGAGASGAVRRWRCVALPREASRGLALIAVERPPAARPAGPALAAEGSAVAALDHALIASSDLESARRLYGDALGLRLALDRRFDLGERRLRILFFRIGGVTVEIAGPQRPPERPDPRDRFGGLALRVPDVAAARARLVAAGRDVSEVRAGAKPGTRVCTVRSGTCGVPTLLIGPGEPATQAAD